MTVADSREGASSKLKRTKNSVPGRGAARSAGPPEYETWLGPFLVVVDGVAS